MKLTALAVLGLVTTAAQAGVYIEMSDQNLETRTTRLAQKMYVQGSSGRFVELPEEPDGTVTVTLIQDGTFYAIDETEKTYVMMDKATMKQFAAKFTAAMAKMKEQMAKMPPEQRAQMEEMLGQLPGGGAGGARNTVEAIDTGKTDTVGGRGCRLWDMKRNGKLDEQICVVPYSALPGKEDLRTIFASFAKMFDEISESAPMLSGMMNEEFSALEKLNGFPVRSRDYEDGKLGPQASVMTTWREESFPDSLFQVPAGYAKKNLEDLSGE